MNTKVEKMPQWLKLHCSSVRNEVQISRTHVIAGYGTPAVIPMLTRQRRGNPETSWLARLAEVSSSGFNRDTASMSMESNLKDYWGQF